MVDKSFIAIVEKLCERDLDLANIIKIYGYPFQWQRKPGFPTLIRIILEQQVSLASAKATFDRLNLVLTELTPQNFLSLNDPQLKAIGFSRQKTRYGRELATAICDRTLDSPFNGSQTRNGLSRHLDLASLQQLNDEEVRKELTKIKGIGDWTADMYLMMALQRQNIFPSKDLAVIIAVKEIKKLPTRPKPPEVETIAAAWQPYRSVATQILWHYYLNTPRIKSEI